MATSQDVVVVPSGWSSLLGVAPDSSDVYDTSEGEISSGIRRVPTVGGPSRLVMALDPRPDDKWIAFLTPDGASVVPADGSSSPRQILTNDAVAWLDDWSLIHPDNRRLMKVPVRFQGNDFTKGDPVQLFGGRDLPQHWEITSDGQRVLVSINACRRRTVFVADTRGALARDALGYGRSASENGRHGEVAIEDRKH
jgi:hypothetical protein